MNNTDPQLTKMVDECLNILRKSLILNEYEKLDFHSQSTFRWIFFGNREIKINLEDTIDNLSEMKLDRALGWLQEQSYYNSDEYQNRLSE